MINAESKLDILVEVLKLIFFKKHWSKDCSATKARVPCPPWDLQADAWSVFGAIEKVLSNKEQFRHLVEVAGEVELDAGSSLLAFDSTHSHEEVLELLYKTLQRLGDLTGYNMYYPLLPTFITEEEFIANDESVVYFFGKLDDEEFEKASEAERERREEFLRREAEENYLSLLAIRDDE